MAIVYRVAKGSPLTNAEVDGNFLHLDTIKANKAITVTGTNGLTGGGDLSANRTLALGTPSTLTVSSTNSASGSTHNHALDLSGRSIIAGNGLVGGGDLNSDRTLSIGTPSTLTATTSNNTTSTSHTHNIDATASRTDSSTTRLFIAAGMNSHRTSGDHDSRYARIPSGTRMLFQQTSAPTGWTKDTSHDNKAIRIVSGTAGSGGSMNFTSAFANQYYVSASGGHSHNAAVGFTSLSESQGAVHNHEVDIAIRGDIPRTMGSGRTQRGPDGNSSGRTTRYTFNSNGGSSHNHGVTVGSVGDHMHSFAIDVEYVDVIIAVRD